MSSSSEQKNRKGVWVGEGGRILVVVVVITSPPNEANSWLRANIRVVLPPAPTKLITSRGLIPKASLSFKFYLAVFSPIEQGELP